MKKNRIFCWICLLMALFAASLAQAQKVKPNLKASIDSQQYIFTAIRANPMRGASKVLSGGYDLTVTKDKIIAFLPYFGVATQAPLDPAEGGIKFTSVSFAYKIVPRKKGGWDVSVDLKDVSNVTSLKLTFFDNGNATLDVNSNMRDPITFTGYIEPYKPRPATL